MLGANIRVLVSGFLAVCSAACGSAEGDTEISATATVSTAPPTVSNPLPTAGTSSASRQTLPASGVVPKLLVRGFGAALDPLLGSARTYDAYKVLLQDEGFDPKDAIDVGNYADNKPMDEMTTQVGSMLEAAMEKYPAGTKFDVFGHSLGGILALRGVLARNLHTRVRTFVALSAPIFGQDKKPLNCQLGFSCGDIYTFYSPFQSEQILQYMNANQAKLDAMKLCSELGPDDGTITSPMAGAQFPNGINVVVPKITHLQLIKSAVAVKALKEQCFGGTF